MGRNKLNIYDGKTLSQWQEEIRQKCDSGEQRRCKQNDSLQELVAKLKRNYECYKARAAVQKFYDGIDQRHQEELDKLWKTLQDCHRFFAQAINGVLKRARKERNRRIQEGNINKKKQPKPETKPKPSPKPNPPIKVTHVNSQINPGADIDVESLSDNELLKLEVDLSRQLVELAGHKQVH